MNSVFAIIICFIAGMGAGLGTGFAGLSAAAVISPMLITFLGFNAYEAIGIALASDVLASAVSAYTYGKSKNIDVKNGIVMLISVLLFTLLGSFVASHIPNSAMGNFSKFMTLLVGLKFIFKPIMKTKETQKEPTVEEIAKELGVDKEEIAFSLDAIQEPVSLQEPVYGDGTENLYIMDQVKDNKNTDEYWAENITITEAMKKLNEKEKMIINKRFFEGRTQVEVADEIGISQAQVSRLEKSAIEHIKRIYK